MEDAGATAVVLPAAEVPAATDTNAVTAEITADAVSVTAAVAGDVTAGNMAANGTSDDKGIFIYGGMCLSLGDDGWEMPFLLPRYYKTINEARAATLVAVQDWAIKHGSYPAAKVRDAKAFKWVPGCKRFARTEYGSFMYSDDKQVVGYWRDMHCFASEGLEMAVTQVRLHESVANSVAERIANRRALGKRVLNNEEQAQQEKRARTS